jgi:hypothetical protein
VVGTGGGVSSLAQWQTFWIFPLVFAVAVTGVFVLGFRDDTAAETVVVRH